MSISTGSDAAIRADDVDLAAWQAIIDRSIAPLEIAPLHDVEFHGSLALTTVDRVAVFDLTATPHEVRRTPRLIERSPASYYKLSLVLDGTVRVEQDDRVAILGPGDLAIYDTSRPYRLVFDTDNRALVIMFPHSFVDLPTDEVARVTATPFPRASPIGRVINPFFAELGRSIEELRGNDSVRLIHTALDLLVTLLSTELAADADPRHRLVRDIRRWIDEHLGDLDLTPLRIAQAHFISPRHLHALFKGEGTTVAGWIRERRLERVRRDIADPLLASLPLSRIAARWGLGDAAHFSKLFKAEFGMSPRDYRASVVHRADDQRALADNVTAPSS